MAVDGYEVRELTVRDAAAFRGLRLTALEEAPQSFGTSLAEERKKLLRSYQRDLGRTKKDPDDFMLGVFSEQTGSELLAVIGFHRHKKIKAHHKGLLWGMYVRSPHRRIGLGRWLLEEALARVKTLPDFEVLQITVVSSNESAIQLYDTFGFETYGCEKKAFKLEGAYHDVFHLSYEVV